MTNKDTSLYFLGILTDDQTAAEITDLKLYCAKNYGSSHALKSPPHITLIPPFRANQEEKKTMAQLISGVVSDTNPFHVQLCNFGHFGKRVIYIDVIKHPQLEQLHRQLYTAILDNGTLPVKSNNHFSAHMTIAFRDLSKEQFDDAWAYFKNKSYRKGFEAKSIVLLQHDGTQWIINQHFPFKK